MKRETDILLASAVKYDIIVEAADDRRESEKGEGGIHNKRTRRLQNNGRNR